MILRGESEEVKLYLEFPRRNMEVRLEDSWKYYDMRGVWYNGKMIKILQPMELTLLYHLLQNTFSKCKGLREFFLGDGEMVTCKGIILYKRKIKRYYGPILNTRVDIIGPRMKVSERSE
ncbi:hypothetical protein IPA_04470 [Ignicoccus pacificus DSM 13166]|uniref:Uncharacterized protein n=1 Tax=Ignicoccus pacificus DSM 13166 TaxID=940294 RepID=A0A977PLJ8_9CREN|nr:hypothetical protein IPA_04470 [Ignicoccus pacificus DSM 13166]